MATATKLAARALILGVLTLVSSVQGSGKLYLSLLSYSTNDDVIKTCCDLIGGLTGTCEEDNMCGLSFHISVSTDGSWSDNERKVVLPAPLAWREGTLAPTVFEFEGWAGGAAVLEVNLVLEDLLSDGQLIDTVHGILTIPGPSDFYRSATLRTDDGTVVHVIYRVACDPNYVGDDCAINCLDQSDIQGCSTQPEESENGSISNQALRYFGSPLARCPVLPMEPTSTSSPTDGAIPTSSMATGSATSSSPTSSVFTTETLYPSQTATSISISITPGSSALPTRFTETLIVHTSTQTSETSDLSTISSSLLEPSTVTADVPANSLQTTETLASIQPTTTRSTMTMSTQQQMTFTTSTQQLTDLTTSMQLLSPTASKEHQSFTKSTQQQPTVITSTPKSRPQITPTQQVSQITTKTTAITTSTTGVTPRPSAPITNVPVRPSTLPVVQYTSTNPSRDPVTSRPTVTIPAFPATTALAQTGDDNPMRYWGAIVGGVVGGLVVLAALGYALYRSRQRTLQKRQEIYTVTPQSISSIEENGTSGRSDVPMTTALL